jgi:hypothetical protein
MQKTMMGIAPARAQMQTTPPATTTTTAARKAAPATVNATAAAAKDGSSEDESKSKSKSEDMDEGSSSIKDDANKNTKRIKNTNTIPLPLPLELFTLPHIFLVIPAHSHCPPNVPFLAVFPPVEFLRIPGSVLVECWYIVLFLVLFQEFPRNWTFRNPGGLTRTDQD